MDTQILGGKKVVVLEKAYHSIRALLDEFKLKDEDVADYSHAAYPASLFNSGHTKFIAFSGQSNRVERWLGPISPNTLADTAAPFIGDLLILNLD